MRSARRWVMIVSVTFVLLSSAAGAGEFPPEGPAVFERDPGGPQPFAVMREHAEALRARAREAQALADRLRREADGLDELAKAHFDPGRASQGMDKRRRALMEAIEDAIGQAEREGRAEVAAEARMRAEQLREEMGRREGEPRMGGSDQMRGRIQSIREQASRAKEQGRFDDAQRLWDEAQNIETRAQRELEVRAMAEHVRTLREKAAVMREQSQQAKREGRHDEAREQWAKAEQIEREVQDGVRKIERFKAESLVKDVRIAADRARARGSHEEAETLAREARRLEERLDGSPKESQREGDLTRIVEELRGEVKQLRREMEEMKARLEQREAN